jgi:hypothetical protein
MRAVSLLLILGGGAPTKEGDGFGAGRSEIRTMAVDSLEIAVGISPQSGNADESVVAEVYVNRYQVAPGDLAVDMAALAATLNGAGEYFVVTCECGDAGCAGIQRGVQVTESASEVSWVIQDWGRRERPEVEYRFDATQYRTEIQRALREFLKLMAGRNDLDTTPYLTRDRMNAAVKAGNVDRWLQIGS